ncbi:hypothetical protein E4T66_18655 [Sinimarinibacterium sp. CAU 1509]|uniref:hypothetical protein n=1 Tax=Sinimarinibacterium sp. CAU 1509 TaxID=2562283 RepID=UPI0010ABD9F4|nr:hypothetical protein [Sinimarinibacterium sp. CAU 1509]TJY57429.1 hypothetical protein E4T66_18655 [Sinimarinibacterium sp. CAU 1509]
MNAETSQDALSASRIEKLPHAQARERLVGLALRDSVEKRYRTEFWGARYLVRPKLLDTIFGDGSQLIGFQPLNSRPQYYVVRVDSGWSLTNTDDDNCVGAHIDEIYEAAEEQFGLAWYPDDPPQRKYGRKWPALHEDGCLWFEMRWPMQPNNPAQGRPE